MPTGKKRISLTVDHQLYTDLERLRKYKKYASLSATVVDLIKEALELQEAVYFAEIVQKRKNEAILSHEQVWKK